MSVSLIIMIFNKSLSLQNIWILNVEIDPQFWLYYGAFISFHKLVYQKDFLACHTWKSHDQQ